METHRWDLTAGLSNIQSPKRRAENYIAITGTSRATATRDLQELVDMGALSRTGERRYTRYWLNLPGTEI